MNDQGIVQYALANLQKTGKIDAKWLDNTPNEVLDGTIALTLNDRTIKLGVAIKKRAEKYPSTKIRGIRQGVSAIYDRCTNHISQNKTRAS